MTNRPTRPRRYGSVLFAFLLATTACTSGNDVTKALDEARRLAAEGNYEEALQKHISTTSKSFRNSHPSTEFDCHLL